jgi:hypothetical protein
MNLHHLLQHLHANAGASRPVGRRARPQLESLEDKLLPSATHLAPLAAPVHTASHVHTATTFDGVWTVKYNVESVITGNFSMTIKNGAITVQGVHVGNVAANGHFTFIEPLQSINFTVNGTIHGNSASGTVTGGGYAGTFSATKQPPSNIPANLTKLDAEYRVTFRGTVPQGDGLAQVVNGSVYFTLHNGIIHPELSKGTGRLGRTGTVSAKISFQSVSMTFTGQAIVTHGVAHITGSWTGTFQGMAASGTWSAAPTGRHVTF